MNKQQGDDDQKQEDNSEDDDPCAGFNDEEIQLIDDFLESFILQNDSGSKVDQIDIKLTLKSLPKKVNEHNVFKCSLFNFDMTKQSLIAFCNDDQDELFRYYDNRNKTRLNKLHKKAKFTH